MRETVCISVGPVCVGVELPEDTKKYERECIRECLGDFGIALNGHPTRIVEASVTRSSSTSVPEGRRIAPAAMADRWEVVYDADRLPLDRAVIFALRCLTADALLNVRGLLVHASAATTDNGVVLFTGSSGIGKSTVAFLLGESAIADDAVAVCPSPTGWIVFNTPFVNLGMPTLAPASGLLRRVFELRQGTVNASRRLDRSLATAVLTKNALTEPPVSGLRFAEVLELADRMADSVPVYQLTRTIDGELERFLSREEPPSTDG